MKILYSIQATGNGHISRAMELLPFLQRYGQVDLFLSGDNSSLDLQADVKFRSRGLSLYYNNGGGLNYWKMLQKTNLKRCFREARDLPVEKYDLVLNDFEAITAMACSLKKVPSIQFGHQASFQSANVPRPEKKELIGEWILKHYASASAYIGLHFERYDDFIFTPVIKNAIRTAEPENKGHITLYLSAYRAESLLPFLQAVPEIRFEVFSKEINTVRLEKNVTLLPVQKDRFDNSLINAAGIITGAGFETPAEALYLGKKVMVLPIRGQYEQYCNAAALERIGVPVIQRIDEQSPALIRQWLAADPLPAVDYSMSVTSLVERVIDTHRICAELPQIPYPQLNFN